MLQVLLLPLGTRGYPYDIINGDVGIKFPEACMYSNDLAPSFQ